MRRAVLIGAFLLCLPAPASSASLAEALKVCENIAGDTKPEDAAKACDTVLADAKASPDQKHAAAFGLGNAHMASGDRNKAIAAFDLALKQKPASHQALEARAAAKSLKEDYDGALADLSAAIKLAPKEPSYFLARGDLYLIGKEDAKTAIADYTQAIALDPNFELAYLQRAEAYLSLNDSGKAFADFDKAVSLTQTNPIPLLRRGSAWREAGNPKKAIADFDAALKIAPGFGSALVQRAEVYEAMKNFDKAIADYEAALKTAPDDPYLKDALAAARKAKASAK